MRSIKKLFCDTDPSDHLDVFTPYGSDKLEIMITHGDSDQSVDLVGSDVVELVSTLQWWLDQKSNHTSPTKEKVGLQSTPTVQSPPSDYAKVIHQILHTPVTDMEDKIDILKQVNSLYVSGGEL